MTGLVAGGEGFVNIAFEAKGLPADRMDHRVTVAPEIAVLGLQALNEPQRFGRRMGFQRVTKEFVEAFGSAGPSRQALIASRAGKSAPAFVAPSTRAPALAGGSCSGFRPTGVVEGPTNWPVGLHFSSLAS